MKKLLVIFIFMMTGNTFAHNDIDAYNPMFADGTDTAIGFYGAQSTGSGTLFKLIDPVRWQFSPQTFAMIQYSQKTTFYRLPARQSFHIIGNIGYQGDKDLSFSGAGFSIDASLFDYKGWYVGLGCGPYMRKTRDRWVESRLVFGETFFIGKNISDKWRAEFYTLHFSNGNLTEKNEGFNFAGFSATYSF